MSEVVRLPVRPFPGLLFTKRQLATERTFDLLDRAAHARPTPAAPRAGPRGACALRSGCSSRMVHTRSATPRLPLEQRVERLERELEYARRGTETGSGLTPSLRKRGNKFTVKVYDPKTPGNQRWIGTFATEEEARDAERAGPRRDHSGCPGAHSRRMVDRVAARLPALRPRDTSHVRLRLEADRGRHR